MAEWQKAKQANFTTLIFFVIFLFDLSFKKTVRLWSHLTSLMRTSECFQNGKLKNWWAVWKKGDFLLQQKWMSEGVRSVTSGEAASLKNATIVANVIVLWIKTPIITFNSQARGHVLFIPDEQRQTARQQLQTTSFPIVVSKISQWKSQPL